MLDLDRLTAALDEHMETKYGFVLGSEDRDVLVRACAEVIDAQMEEFIAWADSTPAVTWGYSGGIKELWRKKQNDASQARPF